MGGGPLTWVTALVKPVISRQVCKACPRLSARSLTRARCSSTMRSRSCTWGPPSAFACSQRAASWGVGWGAQSTASHAGRLEQGLAHREALPSARHGPGLAGPPSKPEPNPQLPRDRVVWSQVALVSPQCGPLLGPHIQLCSVSPNQVPLCPQAVPVHQHYLWAHTEHSTPPFRALQSS